MTDMPLFDDREHVEKEREFFKRFKEEHPELIKAEPEQDNTAEDTTS